VAGIMDESQPDFEIKMNQFVDWFLYTRPLIDHAIRPIEYVVNNSDYTFDSNEKIFYQNLLAIRHSLFEFRKLSKSDLYIKDVFSGYKLIIKDSPVTEGFNKGEVFEARLIPHEDSFIFSSAFCFHPPDATKYILNEVKLINKMKNDSDEERRRKQDELMLKLFQMKNKYDHYRHVALERIYC